jgi:NADH-quinone oxidoreductase subunit M
VLGIYGFTFIGTTGSVFQILSHEVVDGALFVLLGALYDRYATSQINAYGGLAARLPRTATLFVLISLAMVGLPILSGFVGEFLILSSTFTGVSRSLAIAASLGVILSAAYMLWLVQRVFYGPESETALRPTHDLRFRELIVLWPVAILTLIMGVAPTLWLNAIEQGVKPHTQLVDTRFPADGGVR